jgi:hypothetical protein
MIRSAYATRLTTHGVRNMDNRKSRVFAQPDKNGNFFPQLRHKPTEFKPGKAEQAHHARYLEACGA